MTDTHEKLPGIVPTDLPVQPISAQAFAPYGALIEAEEDGKPFGPDDAQLVLGRGTPRFYVMNLHRRPKQFGTITRHLEVTQCLASVGGKPWFIAVAPPDAPEDPDGTPDLARLRAFRVEGDQAIMLSCGTWHVGPFFDEPSLAFFNLELADTNQVDHRNFALDRSLGVRYRLVTGD